MYHKVGNKVIISKEYAFFYPELKKLYDDLQTVILDNTYPFKRRIVRNSSGGYDLATEELFTLILDPSEIWDE